MIVGECNCGAVSFEIAVTVEDVYICHCSICRRNTGGPGIAVSIVSNNDIRWLTGNSNITTWSKPNHDWQCSFCRTCGSPLPGRNDEANYYVPVSLLNCDEDQLRVAHHIYVDSRARWEVIADSGKQHSGAFEG